jgi:hypothetical protein
LLTKAMANFRWLLPVDWNHTETLVALALLVGILVGTFAGQVLVLTEAAFTVDNAIR